MATILLLTTRATAYIFTAYWLYAISDNGTLHAKVFKKFAKRNPQTTWAQFNIYLLLCYTLIMSAWGMIEILSQNAWKIQ